MKKFEMCRVAIKHIPFKFVIMIYKYEKKELFDVYTLLFYVSHNRNGTALQFLLE